MEGPCPDSHLESMGMPQIHSFEVMQKWTSMRRMCWAAGHCRAVVVVAGAEVPCLCLALMVVAQAIVIGMGLVSEVAVGSAARFAVEFAVVPVVAAAAGEDRPREDVWIDSECHSGSVGAAAVAEAVAEADRRLGSAAVAVDIGHY